MTLNHSGGLLLRWFRDTLCKDKLLEARQSGKDAYDLMLADAKPGADRSVGPVAFLRLRHADAWYPRGAFLGMTFATTQANIPKAILEALTFELRVNLDLLRESGIEIEELHAVSGGARNGIWFGLKADICQTPLRVLRITEAACLGAAVLASVGAGDYNCIDSALQGAVELDQMITPSSQNVETYKQCYEFYLELYPKPISLLRRC